MTTHIDIDIDLVGLSRLRPKGAPFRPILTSDIEIAKSVGALRPIMVRHSDEDPKTPYELLCGEYEWRVAQQAGITRVPAAVCDHVNDVDAEKIIRLDTGNRGKSLREEIALVENMQKGFRGKTHASIAAVLGKDRTEITHLLRLRKLPDAVLAFAEKEKNLTRGHLWALAAKPDMAEHLTKRIISEKLSVRETRELVKGKRSSPDGEGDDNGHMKHLEGRLSEALQCTVHLNKGRMEIDFYGNNEILQGILEKIKGFDLEY